MPEKDIDMVNMCKTNGMNVLKRYFLKPQLPVCVAQKTLSGE
jgi:hypothetical protein